MTIVDSSGWLQYLFDGPLAGEYVHLSPSLPVWKMPARFMRELAAGLTTYTALVP